MSFKRKVLGVTFVIVAIAVTSLAIALSYSSACEEPAALPSGAQKMKALVQRCYGGPALLRVENVAKPTSAADEILVKVHAAAVNPLDWHYMRGEPYVMRLSSGIGTPTEWRIGADFSGTVEAVGPDVRRFKTGDAVFGARSGALAEYVAVRESRAVVHKPENVSFEQAAAMPIAALTALQGLRDHGHLKSGQKVLINGASGGVGTFAVQIAKALGAQVTGVCSTRNVDLVRSLGADHVIDYTKEDFIADAQRYDVLLDNVGNRSFFDLARVVEPEGVMVIVGGPSDDPWLGPTVKIIKGKALSPLIDQRIVTFFAELNQGDLETLAALAREGRLTSAIDRRYSLDEAASALEYLERGRARGKVVVTLDTE
jgi:NADPH:quinone reductase-like Zn-dependent oxidoreductase